MRPVAGKWVDHKNGNPLDVRRQNLRECEPRHNARNCRQRRNAFRSRFKGVTWDARRKTWRPTIAVDGKRMRLGSFKNEEDAARAYDAAARECHGEFACINFPPSPNRP